MRLYRIFFGVLIVLLMAAIGVKADLVTNTVGSTDFQDGADDDWYWSGSNTVVTADSGPLGSGDYALWGSPHPSNLRLNILNEDNAEYLGNYVDGGVITLSFDAMNPVTNDDSLKLFAVVYDKGRGDPAISLWASLQFAAVTNDGVWRSFEISLQEADVQQVYGAASFNDVFSNVQMLSLRHQVDSNQGNGSNLSSANNGVFIDNIKLTGVVPEPAVAGFITFGGAFMLGIKRLIRKRETDDSTPV
ncbi:MAG: hypothetical protein K9M45_02335 [Kiritimatiellales bacterium]|nr:hypothetical protein [Kiritimatiellales bacterium]